MFFFEQKIKIIIYNLKNLINKITSILIPIVIGILANLWQLFPKEARDILFEPCKAADQFISSKDEKAD